MHQHHFVHATSSTLTLPNLGQHYGAWKLFACRCGKLWHGICSATSRTPALTVAQWMRQEQRAAVQT